uniref:Dystonin n=1 Tax=Propithecus coquereli TaxID=379532 RepID=A0A2K6H058_PROCO
MAGYLSPAAYLYAEEQEYLQAYEDVLERYKDERDKVQKKTFTKWINQHLMKVRKHVNDLYEDLRDGHNLISLLEVLSGDTLPREKGRMRFHRLQNVQIALDYLKRRQVKLVNIRNDDITDGNPKLTLGLIWTIILHFQISDIHVTGESEDMSAKERLLLWTQQATEGYAGIRCENFTTCWRDGKLFNAIIHKYRPDLIDMNTVAVQSNLANLEHAFYVAEKIGVIRLLDPEDVDVSSPDEKSVITYVSSLYDAFPKVPEGGEGIGANDVEVKWIEYQNMVNYLIQWIRHHVTTMSERTFPNNPVELKALYNQYLQFKETEIPPKETEKSKIKRLYKLLEIWIEFGRIKLLQGYHPNDIEKEWGKLIIAMLEREKALRPEVERVHSLWQVPFILYLILFWIFFRVAKLRDEIMALRNECSSVYSKGRLLTTEQTKLMISGITQSLNSGFSQTLHPSLNSGLTQSLTPSLTSSSVTSGLSSGMTSRLTPSVTPAYTPGFPSGLVSNFSSGVEPNSLQTLKLMQIRKPLLKSSLLDQNLTEEEINMKFVQDLLNWVDEMQVQLDRTEWGSDLPSVESHLENHKNVHKAIEEFESSLKEAKISEIQMTAPLKLTYAEKLHRLESQYAKLLNTSRNQERSRAFFLDLLKVYFEWSKKEYHFQSKNAYRAAMQTQWSWILQLCQCVEQHIKENTAYFEFFNDAKEATDYLRNLKDAIQRKYSCDRSSSIHKLEDLVQESMEEKEELLQYKSTVATLMGKAKTIIQLKPRNSDCPLKTSIPIKAICDYRQIEITIYKDDECVLANNSHRAKWKVISPTGNEAMVPSVCFTVPPPNKEAVDLANRFIEETNCYFTKALELINMEYFTQKKNNRSSTLWHESHINMKSVVSWHYLINEIDKIRASNVASIKTMLPGEHQQVLSNLQSRFDDFLEDSQESQIFSGSDITQLEKEVNVCKQYYQELLKSAEREEQEESIYNLYISEVRNIRLRLENCEDRLIRQIRTPLERDDLHESVFRITEQEKLKKELERLKDDLGTITNKCEEFFSQAAASPSVPTLRSELSVVVQNMNQVYSMSSTYIDKLKTVNLVLKNTQAAEALVKLYETKLCEEEAVIADKNNIENLISTLKQWRSEVDEKREVFHALEDELQKAKAISDEMFKTYKERDLDFDWHKEKADQLVERWQNVHVQIDNRLVSFFMLVSEIEMKQSKMDECQKYAEQYSATVKLEENTFTRRTLEDHLKRKDLSLNDLDHLLECIFFLTTHTCQKSLEEEKKEHVDKAKELQKWVSNISKTLKDGEKAGKSPFSEQKISSEEISTKKEQLSEALQTMQLFLAKHGDKMTDEERNELEKQVKTLQEGYNLLFSESLKQLQESQTSGDVKVEEKLDKVIAGTIDQTTGEVLSIFQAVLRGLIDYGTGIRLLESQLMISGLISPELKKCFDLKDAESHGVIDEQILCQLQELNNAKEIISAMSSTTIPVLDALAQSVISESMAIKVLEILLSTGFLVIPATGEQLTLQKAFQQNLISSSLFSKVLERQNMCKDLIDPYTSEKVSLIDMVQRSILQENTGMWLLPVRPQEGGRITLKCGRNISILRAAHEGLIDRETMFRLLGAQLLSGGLINGNSGQRMTVEEAMAEGVIDRDTASSVLTYQVETGGIIHSNPAKRLTVDEAVQCDLITSSSALLVLEAQRGYVGLIWPHSGEIFPTSSSLQQELITNELAYKILNGRQKIAALYIPESSQVIGLDVAKQLGIIDNNTALILKNIILPDKMPDLGDLETCKNARRWLSFCKFQPSTVHDYRQEEDVFDGEEPVATQSSEQTKKLFLSYLMINSYMDANTGQRLLLYDGDLDEAVGMLLEGCSTELDGDTPVKDCLDVLSFPGIFLNNAPSKEKDECAVSPGHFDQCHCREPEHKETPENKNSVIDEEFHEMRNNVISSGFWQSESPANIIPIDHKVNSSSSVCVPSPVSYLTQTELAEVSMLRHDSENMLKHCENQTQVETKEHANECSHSKDIKNFASDLITNPIVKSKTSRFCDLSETENEDNINKDSLIFDYSPRLSALLTHDKLRHSQGGFNDAHTPDSSGNKCDNSTLSFNDQTTLSGHRMGEKFQDQFLGIAAINISLQGEDSGQKALNIGCSNPQVQCHNDKYISYTSGEDEKIHTASRQKPEDEQNEAELEEYSRAAPVCGMPLLEETISAGDYETSLLDGQKSDTGTDTDSDDDFYDTPLFEDDDHDSLLLEGDDRDGLQPEDYDTLQEENDGMTPLGDVFYDVSKGNENSVVSQEGLVGSLSVRGKAQCLQDFLVGIEKAELDSGEEIHLNSFSSEKVNRQSLETVLERECTNNLEGDESDSFTDYEIVGKEESFSASLKFDDTGCWRGRKEEYVTGQEFQSDTDYLDSMQSEESYGDYICDSNDQDDDDDDDSEGGGGVGEENRKPKCQDETEDMDIQLCASIVSEKENNDESQSINKTIFLDKRNDYSFIEKQQSANVLQLESTSKSSLVNERRNAPEYTTEIVGKSKENLLNDEITLKDILLPTIKDAESEKTFGSVNISSNNSNISSSSELGSLTNTEVKLIQEPQSTDSVKGRDQYFEDVTPKVDSSLDKIIYSEPDLIGEPAERSHFSSIASVTDKDHEGNGRDLIKGRDDKNDAPIEDEKSIQKAYSGRGEVLVEGLVEEDNEYLQLLPSKSTRDSSNLANSPLPFPQITNNEELNQKGSLKKATVALKDEPENLQTMVGKSPVQFENLEEIFDTSVSKVISDDITSDIPSSEGSTCIEKHSLTDGPEKELDLFAYLKHCAKNIKAKDLPKPNEDIPSCVLIAAPPVKEHLQLGINHAEEKSTRSQEDSPLKEMIQHNDLCTKESITEGGTEIPQLTPESKETTLSILPLKNVEDLGKNTDFVPSELCRNGIKNDNSSSTLDTDYSLLEINKEKERIEKQPPKEQALSPRPQEKEVQIPELSQVFVEDVKDILKSRLKESHRNPQDVEEPLACVDTRILIQNLIKRVSTSQLVNEASNIPSDSKISDYTGISPISSSSELRAENRDDPIANLKSQLLLAILKQNQHSQKIPGAFELMRELTQMEYDLSKRGITSTVLPLQLENIFCKLLADGYSEKVEQVGDLNQKACSTSEMVEEKPHVLGDLKSKEGNHCSLNLQTIKEIGLESSTVCASALPRDEKLEELGNDSPNHLECISESKRMTSGDCSMEQFSSELQQCLQHTEKMHEYLALLQDMKPPLDNQESLDNNLETLKNQFKQLETFELGLAPIAVILRKDMKLAEDFLKSLPSDFPRGHLEELSASHQSLQTAFSSLSNMSSERRKQIMLAIDSEMVEFSHKVKYFMFRGKSVKDIAIVNVQDTEHVKKSLEFLKNVIKELGHTKMQLETTAFDVQFFISEYAQDLSPNQNKQLLGLLNTTQKCFLDVQESVTTQVERLETQLQLEQDLDDQKVLGNYLLLDKEQQRKGPKVYQGGERVQVGAAKSVTLSLLEGYGQFVSAQAQHEKIISQHQAVIIATQSAQALLEKQGHYLSPEEKEKLQKNMKELKAHYETALAESEKKMKLTHSLQEELEKFDADYAEFEHWLQQSEQELENLEAGADDFSGLMTKLKRQKSFSEDVISHKGDLRYITISGNRVLEAAKSCSRRDGTTHREVQSKLDHATDRFRSLYSKCNVLGNNLKDLVDKYQHYEDASCGLISGLQACEATASKHLSEPIAVDPKNLQRQLEETKALQGQISSQQVAVEKLKKTAEVLLDARGSLLPAKNDIQKTLDDIVGRYDDLSKSVNERNEKLQITLTRSLSVQDGLDEMLDWMGSVESSLKEQGQVPLNSAALQDIISKNLMLEQDIAGRQSSINAMNEKVKKFMETTDPSTASSLQAKMKDLSVRFAEAGRKHKEKLAKMEELKTKVELFENLSEKLQTFLETKTQALTEVDVPGKDVTELSQHMQESTSEFLEHKKDLEVLHSLLKEISSHGLPGDKALVFEKTNNLSKKFKEMEDTIKENYSEAEAGESLEPRSLRLFNIFAGGVVLNGEGTAPNTQEFLANKGLTSIKKDMTDISHGYEDLGLLLKDKIAELNSKLSKLQKAQEESSAMMQWLQKMNKTATKWHEKPTPTDTEAVKAQVEQNKSFEAELKQNVNKVQELKDTLTELLEENPDTPEASKWKQMLTEIESKWQELNQLTIDRQQKLEESSNNLTQFQTIEAQLKQWLVEKELMVSVLGPLSIDPNMLNTQRQQVQILLQEFDTRKPQYEQLTAAGQGILSRPGEDPSLHGIVKEQLAAVTQKWDSLTGQLSDRCAWIDQAIVKSTQYQSLLRSLSDKLNDFDNKLSSILAVGTHPDAMNQQLETAQKMKQEIEQETKQIKVAQTLCEDLSALVKEEYLKAELSRQLEGILKSFKDIEQKAENHVQHLQSACASSHQFQQMSRDFQAWLDTKKEEQNKSHPISAKLDVLESLIKDQKDFSKTLTAQSNIYEKTIAEGENLLLKTQGSEKAALQLQLNTIKTNWDGFNKQVKEREDKLKDSLEKALKYKEHVETLRPWIDKCQNDLEEIKFCLDPAETESSIAKLKSLQKEMDQHFGMVELLNNTANSLLSVCETDKEVVTDENKSLIQKVDMVTEQLHSKKFSLENMAQKFKEFQEVSKEAQRQLQCAKEQLDIHDSLGPQAYSNKNLTMLQTQQKSLQTLKPQVELAKRLAQDLVVETSDSKGTSDILLQAETLAQEHNAVSQQVDEKCSFLETKLQGIGHFQNTIREMFSQFAEFDDELDSMAPVGRDVETLQKQKESIKAFLKKLEALIASNDNANKTCKMMLATEETSPDLIGIKRDLEALSKQCNKLLDRAQAREEQVEGTIERLEEFYSKLKDFSTLLRKAEEHEESQGPVGMETETINQQLNVFKVFQKEEIEPLQVKQQDVNWLGQGLIQSAAKSTSTQGLEHDLDDVNARWKTLNKKVAQRAAQLQEALLHCGRFQDALESLLSWMVDTEELVANQKPPSAEFKVVKAQIQEQKLLQRLLDDRKSTVEVIKREGEKIAATAEPADKVKILKQLSLLDSRWEALLNKAETRNRQLEGISVVAQQFHETLEPLNEWLTTVEKRLVNCEPIGTQASKLEDQIAQHKVLQEDILLRKQNVDQALLNGLELLKQTTGDEVLIIQDKLEAIKARYKDITKLSTDVAKTLEQALQLARRLHSTHEELCTWLDKVEVELLSYETQVLQGEAASQAQVRQKELQKEAKNNKALLDSLNEVSSALLELVPWRAREGLEKMVAEDNERYRLVSDTITQKVEEIDAAILRSQQFDQAADAELSWITETEKKLMSLGDIRLEQDQTSAQLQVQKTFTMEILRHKDIIDELVKSGHKVMTTCSEEEKQSMKKKLDKVLKKYDAICQINSERYLQLERAQSLVNQFWETYEELWPWLTETQRIISQLPAPALEYETLRQQQEEHRQLRELIAEHKPHIDKMNKTGPQLLELSPGEGFSIQEKYVAADTLYSQIKEDVKKRAVALDEAISQSTQFHDKTDQILESLERIVERLRQPPSISAEVEKIKEQISENKNVSVDMEKLQPLYETLKQRGEEMIARSGGTDKDISAKAVQDKLDQMVFIWENIHTLVEEREAKLLDVMELAEKFWCDHMSLVVTTKDTQDFIRDLEDPGIDPSVVKQQQEAAEAIREEIDGLQEELDIVINLGSELIAACGEPDKPIVKKSIDELNSAWDSLNKAWKDRVDKLEEAMQAAVQYQDGLQVRGLQWARWSLLEGGIIPIGQFKSEAYQQQIEMERLNHQAELLLKKVTEESDKHTVQDPLMELKLIWDSLDERIINRQHKLEGALLALGQFQHALDELLTWLTHTEGLLSEQKPVGGDPKAIEIELAKHHVLQNDVLAHQSTVEAVNKAGNDLIESSAGEEASNLQNKLEVLNQRWQNVLEKTEQRKQQLDGALRQAKGFHGEIEDLQQWLTDTERHLLASKPLGGLPETAKEQLNAHMEICAAFDAKEETYMSLMQKGQQMLARCPKSAETNIDQDINNLKEKWESVETKLNERKTKLEEALNLAMEFHNSLQDFINWLTQAEQTLNVASRPSLILDTVLFQIDEHKVFANEVNSHREQIIELDKTGTHLKYFSQKQDVVLIKNLLISVQSRWEKVVQRLVERGRSLDDARKRAKQFHEAWSKLMEWLEESEKSLDSELEIANDPDKIKTQLAQHKEFQKSLGAKHSVYDTTNRTGRSLKEKTSLADDNLKLDDMLSELRDKWDTICGKSVERQNKLEEALLFSGQFTDALQALIDWLYRVEPQLAEDQPVHGDIDLVMNLIDNHKAFQKELGKRTSSVQALKRSARELIEGSRDDSSWVKVQMQELSTRWETVCALSISKQTRLEAALRQAEEFHSVVHALLEWLAEAEQTLRFHGVLPDDEDALRTLIDQHKEFMKKLEEKRAELNKATSMGDAVLAICHPDSITTIKHWITIIRARFEEVLAWAKQHQQRLASALAGLIAKQELLEALLAWLQWAETTLTDKDKEVIPQEIEEVKALIAEHQTFMEEMTRKQPDVDKVTKTYKRRAADPSSLQSHIPVLDKGRAGRKRFPASSLYPSGSQTQIETKNPRVNLLVSKWQQVWLLALERRRKLNDALDRLEELREFANFDFDIWRKKYMRWMNHKKSRVMDFFRRIDKDQDGKITRQEFIDGILSSKFPTSRLEMSAVADIFDRDGDGYIDYYEFVAALHPNKDAYKPITDADKIEDEVTRQVAKCKCAKRFQVEQIGDNKYRVSFQNNFFGDSQQLRLVRILRSTVMVRVGGGWMALDEFLVKNDPCRVHHHGSKMLRSESNSSITTTQPTIAKGRTNMELREKFILADGASQGMAAFRPRGRRSRPSSRGASPNRSASVSSQAGQAASPQVPATSTPKGTPIQGSKLRLPGYLSGKSFHSGEDSGLITTAAARVRTQFADSKKTPSRPGSRAGSKAGSRASSRRGSDASDFDISEIQSVCSDVEAVPQTHRPTPRAGSRPSTAKPSKIPTPQRKSPASKLDKSSKR